MKAADETSVLTRSGPARIGEDEAAWAERLRAGDEWAFERLFKTYYQPLVGFARGYTRTLADAEDLVSEVFSSLWRRRTELAPGTALRPYLYAAVRNQCLMHRRRLRVRDYVYTTAEPSGGPDPETALHEKELHRLARHVIGLLPERRRMIFTLSRQHGLTYSEIAAVLGLSVNTVENQMVSALKFLGARLKPFLRNS